MRKIDKPYKRVMIAGGGNIGATLAMNIEKQYQVKVIERSYSRCRYLSERLKRSIVLNGSPLNEATFPARLKEELAERKREEDRVVVLKSAPTTPYTRWIAISRLIDQAGGLLTLEVTEEKSIEVR